MFRGVVLKNVMGIGARAELGPRSAVATGLLTSSILFGLAHAYQEPAGIAMTAVAGLLDGTLYLLSPGNLWPPVLMHGLTDTIGFLSLYFGLAPA